MKLFVDNKPIHIVKSSKLLDPTEFDCMLDGRITSLSASVFKGDVLIRKAEKGLFESLFLLMQDNKLKKLDSITVTVDDNTSVKHYLKSRFKIIEAAGGIVRKDDKILLIYRLKKWDLPKGKLDKGETPSQAAVREVEEECNISVTLGDKIGSTWHTYTQNGKRILKKTHWYSMVCTDDTHMAPQLEEDIEDIRWMDTRELRYSLYDSYGTIRSVFQKYNKLRKKLNQSL